MLHMPQEERQWTDQTRRGYIYAGSWRPLRFLSFSAILLVCFCSASLTQLSSHKNKEINKNNNNHPHNLLLDLELAHLDEFLQLFLQKWRGQFFSAFLGSWRISWSFMIDANVRISCHPWAGEQSMKSLRLQSNFPLPTVIHQPLGHSSWRLLCFEVAPPESLLCIPIHLRLNRASPPGLWK